MSYAVETNAEGVTRFEDGTPSKEDMIRAEKHIFVDRDYDAAVKVQYVQGAYQMVRGMVFLLSPNK